jgi:hypothetical protein
MNRWTAAQSLGAVGESLFQSAYREGGMRIRAYQRAGSENDSSELETDRYLFLTTARQFDLRIMIDLLIGPAQHYRELLKRYALGHCNGKMMWEQFLDFLPDWNSVKSEVRNAVPGNPILAFRDALLNWSIRWHLDADWCRDRAIAAIRLWGWSKGAQRYFCWDSLDLWCCVQERLKITDQLCDDEQKLVRNLANDPGAFGIRVTRSKPKHRDEDEFFKRLSKMPKPKSKLLPPNIFMKPLAEYLNTARRHLEEHPSLSSFSEAKRQKTIAKLLAGPARDYHAEWERYFKSRGWKQTRQQPEHLKHLMWAVRHQVGGVEYNQIAADPPPVPIDTVSKVISGILKRLGLRNRKRRGRPPGQITS